MDVLMLAVVTFGFLGVLVVFIYIVDRINSLERETRELITTLNKTPPVNKGPYAGLSGRKLWDAMCGKHEGLDPVLVEDVRGRYADALTAHVRATFQEGASDAALGSVALPKNPRPVVTPYGTLESWLPTNELVVIYNAGVDSINREGFDLSQVRTGLDAAVSQLFVQTLLRPPEPGLSGLLMPPQPSDISTVRPDADVTPRN